MSPGPTSPYFTIAPTPYGGRGAFASQHIPKNTLILTCEAPYASVIHRKFRKEVCAWCFSWSWEVTRKGSWNISIALELQQAAEGGKASGGRKNGAGGPNAGVWFCGEACRDAWISDGEGMTSLEDHPHHAGVRGIINAVLERCLTTMAKDRTKPRTIQTPGGIELGWVAFLQSLEDLDSTTDISSSFLEDAWERAEKLSSFSRSSTPVATISSSRKSNTKLIPISPAMLTEFELDTARFVLAGLLKKCIEEFSQTSTSTRTPASSTYSSGTWSDVLDLQDNALTHIQAKPHILATHVRVWIFIKFVVHSAVRETKNLSEQTKQLVHLLKKSVDTPYDTRAILGREHGNVFGIWDLAPEGVDSEMLGWGLYSFGSYFNHGMSCASRG